MTKREQLIGITALVMVTAFAGILLVQKQGGGNAQPPGATYYFPNPINTVYSVNDEPVALHDGVAVVETGIGATQKITTKVFGQPMYGDLNGDGQADAAVLLAQDTGGSGVQYYVAAARISGGQWIGSNAILLGDRIAPQTMRIVNGVVEVNYAERRPTDPFTIAPSIGVTKRLVLTGDVLREEKR